jgi:branched-chain amino acid aminotransferase
VLENIGKHYILNGKVKSAAEYRRKQYTDRVYEVVRIVDGKPLFLDEHYQRLQNSTMLLNKPFKLTKEGMQKDIDNLIREEEILNNNIMIILYFDKERFWHIIYFRKSFYPCVDMYKEGVDTSLFNFQRSVPNAKVLNLDYRSAIMNELHNKKVFEVFLVNEEGVITEGGKTNVFFVKNDVFYTPPEGMILKGITRKHVIDIVIELEYKIEEKKIYENELSEFDGVFLTGTSVGVLPVGQIDEHCFNSSQNEAIISVHKKYNTMIKAVIKKC